MIQFYRHPSAPFPNELTSWLLLAILTLHFPVEMIQFDEISH